MPTAGVPQSPLVVCGLYGLSVAFSVLPMVLIVLQHKVREDLVYLVFLSGFLVFNGLGAISPRVLGGPYSITFALTNLCVSVTFLALYPVIGFGPWRFRVSRYLDIESCPAEADGLLVRLFAAMWMVVAALSVIYFVLAPYSIFTRGLIGDWSSAVAYRVQMFMTNPRRYSRFQPVLFQAPLFLVVLVGVIRYSTKWMAKWTALFLAALVGALCLAVSQFIFVFAVFVLAAVAAVHLLSTSFSLRKIGALVVSGSVLLLGASTS